MCRKRRTHNLLPVFCAILVGGLPLLARAEVHELKPTVTARTCSEGHRSTDEVAGYWSDHGRTSGNATWLRFEIPPFSGARVVKATLNIGPIAQFNHPWDAGVMVHYVPEDGWTGEDIHPGWPVADVGLSNRSPHDKGGTPSERLSSDITPWLKLGGGGPGAGLSVRLSHSGGGLRGWRAVEQTTLTITTEALLDFGPPRQPPSGPVGLAARSALTTVFAEEPPAPEPAPELRLAAARGESESGQIVVIAGAAAIRVAGVQAGELRSRDGADHIAAEHVKVQLVGYVTVRQNSWRGWNRPGMWPDVLLPMRPFDVPAGHCRVVWVTVRVPRDVAPGDYTGNLTVRYSDGTSAAAAMNLRVWDFALPPSPALQTSYWTAMGHAYPAGLADAPMAQALHDLFGAYRTSTDTWAGIRYYREPDGHITVDWQATRRNIEYAIETAGFNTINVSSGCWGGAPFGGKTPVYDRRTGKPLSEDERAKALAGTDLMALYLNEVCDWLEQKSWLNRAYMQLWDEAKRDTWSWGCAKAYPDVRQREPRLRLLCVVGVHPQLQGLFDIWVPHLNFHDGDTYRQVREGRRLEGRKNFPATVTASSTGGWQNAAFYTYRPVDAYDGCDYTKWVPKSAPTPEAPAWLRFEFEQAQRIDGMAVRPYGDRNALTDLRVEVSADGAQFAPVSLRPTGDGEWAFDDGEYRAIRLTWGTPPADFAPTDAQPVPPPETSSIGVREVEFIRAGLPRESSLPRPRDRRPCETWEYNVGADWPSVCIDARPQEHRATGWLMWLHGSTGYLNYGGGQWRGAIIDMDEALADPPPLIWRARGNGGPNIAWPGCRGPLASIRFARFRDGIDDYDYLTLLEQCSKDHPLLRALRARGTAVAATPEAIEDARERLAEAIEDTAR